MADLLSCNVCNPGWASVGDRYRRECLRLKGGQHSLQCYKWSGEGCERCARGTVKVAATHGGASFLTSSKGYCKGMWAAASLCRSCEQLGCPGRCRAGSGCSRCPRGSVRLRTTPPRDHGSEQWRGYCTALEPKPYEPAPKLPTVCLRAKEVSACLQGAGLGRGAALLAHASSRANSGPHLRSLLCRTCTARAASGSTASAAPPAPRACSGARCGRPPWLAAPSCGSSLRAMAATLLASDVSSAPRAAPDTSVPGPLRQTLVLFS